jgi:hypothetical protein
MIVAEMPHGLATWAARPPELPAPFVLGGVELGGQSIAIEIIRYTEGT